MNFQELVKLFKKEVSSGFMWKDRYITFLNAGNMIEEMLVNPEFNRRERIHDWRNYISDWARQNWDKLSMEQRLIIAVLANEKADAEDWD